MTKSRVLSAGLTASVLAIAPDVVRPRRRSTGRTAIHPRITAAITALIGMVAVTGAAAFWWPARGCCGSCRHRSGAGRGALRGDRQRGGLLHVRSAAEPAGLLRAAAVLRPSGILRTAAVLRAFVRRRLSTIPGYRRTITQPAPQQYHKNAQPAPTYAPPTQGYYAPPAQPTTRRRIYPPANNTYYRQRGAAPVSYTRTTTPAERGS